MSVEILYLAKNRLEFTKASFECLLENTNWGLVSRLVVYDDNSIDGSAEWIIERLKKFTTPFEMRFSNLGGPASIMSNYLMKSKADIFAKIDNDVMVPPGWLDKCLIPMNYEEPQLDLLGIEPWMSRTPHYLGSKPVVHPELDGIAMKLAEITGDPQYARCDSIGGIGLMRRSAFLKYPNLVQHSIYGGFTEWQLSHRDIVKGWMVPPLNVFLLDRMPIEPWRSLSVDYISKGWQRPWTNYPIDNPFWSWYTK